MLDIWLRMVLSFEELVCFLEFTMIHGGDDETDGQADKHTF